MSFDIPTNLYPTTTSTSGGASSSGINWGSPFVSGILPTLTKAAKDLPGIASGMSGLLQGQYNSLMQQAMGPQAFQGTLNQLAAKNMLNSSVASDAMSKTATPIAQSIANKGWESQLAGQQARMNVPSILGQLAQLGQQSNSSSTSSSNTSNPLAPYELMAQLIMANMGS
jgi:hypothetical protein